MPRNALALALIGLLLAGCQQPQQEHWIGTSTADGQSHAATLTFTRLDTRLDGSYTVGAASGAFAGRLDGEALTATLTPSQTCSYTLTGTMDGAALDATFAPKDCPGGQTGTWSLEKKP